MDHPPRIARRRHIRVGHVPRVGPMCTFWRNKQWWSGLWWYTPQVQYRPWSLLCGDTPRYPRVHGGTQSRTACWRTAHKTTELSGVNGCCSIVLTNFFSLHTINVSCHHGTSAVTHLQFRLCSVRQSMSTSPPLRAPDMKRPANQWQHVGPAQFMHIHEQQFQVIYPSPSHCLRSRYWKQNLYVTTDIHHTKHILWRVSDCNPSYPMCVCECVVTSCSAREAVAGSEAWLPWSQHCQPSGTRATLSLHNHTPQSHLHTITIITNNHHYCSR